MRLYHVTRVDRLASILEHGLRVAYCDPDARIKGVWVCTSSRIAWAIVHTQRKHRATLERVAVLEVEVDRKSLKRFRTGLWVSESDIAPERIKAARPGESYGQSIA